MGLFALTFIPKGEDLLAPYLGHQVHYAQAMGLLKKGLGTHLLGHHSTGVDVIIDGRQTGSGGRRG
jgi:hypothetical protein